MTDGRRVRLGPLPVNSAIDRFRQRADLLLARMVAVEVGLAEQHAGEQQRRVDRRQLASSVTLAVPHVEEVIEEAPVAAHAARRGALRSVMQELQRREHPRSRLLAADKAALDPDGIRRERESHGRNA